MDLEKIADVLGRVYCIADADIADRRGSVVLKLEYAGQYYMFKTIDKDSEDALYREELLLQELHTLLTLGDSITNTFVSFGRDAEIGTWLIAKWAPGKSLSAIAREMREKGMPSCFGAFLDVVKMVLDKYCVIHRTGILHRDVQPLHVVIDGQDNIGILDWGLSSSIYHANIPYRGAFVHYAAPEIASQMIREIPSIEYAVYAEMYSLGAMFFFLYTGEVPTAYGMKDDMREKLHQIIQGNLRDPRDIVDVETRAENMFCDFLLKCMDINPRNRFASLQDMSDDIAVIQAVHDAM